MTSGYAVAAIITSGSSFHSIALEASDRSRHRHQIWDECTHWALSIMPCLPMKLEGCLPDAPVTVSQAGRRCLFRTSSRRSSQGQECGAQVAPISRAKICSLRASGTCRARQKLLVQFGDAHDQPVHVMCGSRIWQQRSLTKPASKRCSCWLQGNCREGNIV